MAGEHDTVDEAPASFGDLVVLVRGRMSRLSPSHRLLAELVMGDPERVAFMSAAEMAAATRVEESTVHRFVAELGLDSYRVLADLCRAALREGGHLLRRFAHLQQLGVHDLDEDPLAQTLVSDQANIARTLGRIDPDTWDRAIETLAAAPRVFLFGIGKCYVVGYHFGLLLRLVRDEVFSLAPGPGSLIDDLRRIRPGDCFVGIGIHRYGAETVRSFRWAQRAGATTIALTDNEASPLVRGADMVFFVETAGVSLLRSITGFVSLSQALATSTAAALGAEARPILQRKEELITQFGIYEDIDDIDRPGPPDRPEPPDVPESSDPSDLPEPPDPPGNGS
jgi:DNA-binding MurR/RpiR family transcriptional regulator